jgi:CheY-like chemotaxis protein
MNGLTFTHELKNDAHWQQIPVLVVSNSANTDNVKSMLELGVKKYLLKAEYRLEEIIDLLKDIINKSKRMKKILLVEDEQLLIESLVKRLTHEGFEVVVAHDGEDGLEKVTREKPDLILLDLIMPVMDGITMLKKLRVTADGKNIPVIILTNLSDENKFEEAMKAGSTDYLIKSDYTLEQLVERIKLRLGL